MTFIKGELYQIRVYCRCVHVFYGVDEKVNVSKTTQINIEENELISHGHSYSYNISMKTLL